jgi:hypothetical protein
MHLYLNLLMRQLYLFLNLQIIVYMDLCMHLPPASYLDAVFDTISLIEAFAAISIYTAIFDAFHCCLTIAVQASTIPARPLFHLCLHTHTLTLAIPPRSGLFHSLRI